MNFELEQRRLIELINNRHLSDFEEAAKIYSALAMNEYKNLLKYARCNAYKSSYAAEINEKYQDDHPGTSTTSFTGDIDEPQHACIDFDSVVSDAIEKGLHYLIQWFKGENCFIFGTDQKNCYLKGWLRLIIQGTAGMGTLRQHARSRNSTRTMLWGDADEFPQDESADVQANHMKWSLANDIHDTVAGLPLRERWSITTYYGIGIEMVQKNTKWVFRLAELMGFNSRIAQAMQCRARNAQILLKPSWTTREVAISLDCDEKTVRNLIGRGTTRLRRNPKILGWQ